MRNKNKYIAKYTAQRPQNTVHESRIAAQKYARLRRKALLNSYIANIFALALCMTMLLGTTIAWFTSEVTNEQNEIYIGTLDLDLKLYTNGEYNETDAEDEENWTSLKADNAPTIFDRNAFDVNDSTDNEVKWAPGFTAIETLKVVNQGDLAFNYQLGFTLSTKDENGEISRIVNDDKINKIAEHFTVYVRNRQENVEVQTLSSFKDIESETGMWQEMSLSDVLMKGIAVFSGNMENNDVGKTVDYDEDGQAKVIFKSTEHIYDIAIHMNDSTQKMLNFDENAEQNDPNSIMGESIVFNVKLVARQKSDYSSEAPMPWMGNADTSWYNDTNGEFEITSAEQLAGLAKLVNEGESFSGKIITLTKNIDLANENWTPIGNGSKPFKGTFDGNGHTISNLKVEGNGYLGLFGNNEGTINKLMVEYAKIKGTENYVGVIAGKTDEGKITDCAVIGCTVNGVLVQNQSPRDDD